MLNRRISRCLPPRCRCARRGSAPPRRPKDKVILLLNWYVYSEHAPFFLGKERGYFDAGGHRPRHPGRPRLGRDGAGGRRRHGDLRLRRRADDDQGRRQGRAGDRDRRRAADIADVGDGLLRQEHQEARGHQGQDRRGHARRLDVADLAAVPQEDEPQGRRLQAGRRRRADQAQRRDQRPGRPAAGLRDGPGDQAAGRDQEAGLSDPLRRLRRQPGELRHHRQQGRRSTRSPTW